MATKKAPSTPAKKSAKASSTGSEVKPAAKSAATKAPAKSVAKKTAASTETKASSKKSASHKEISEHAHKLWEQGGRHHGSHVDHWLRAEKELNG